MKKAACTFLLVCLLPLLLVCAAGAASLGDPDGDGAVTAADARLALRFSVGLDVPDEARRLAADADHSGDLAAGDARLILRNAVGLEAFTHPFGRADGGARLIRPATCVDEGVLRTFCVCGAWRDDPVKKTGVHTYPENWTVITPAACKTKGEQEKRCTVCGFRIAEKIPAAGHDWVEKETPATCTENGRTVKTCARCGAEKTEITQKKLGHDYSVTQTVPATCTENGSETPVCSRCGAKGKTAVLPKLGHDPVVTETAAATCETAGYERRVCVRCGLQAEDTVCPALGHDDQKARSAPPTCTADGYAVYVCARCGRETAPEAIPMLGHDYTESVTVEPTCKAEGSVTLRCSRCGAEGERRAIPKSAHRYGEARAVPATCTADGFEERTCLLCGFVLQTPADPPPGHDYVPGPAAVTDCTAGGERTCVCAVCGDKKTEPVPPAPHTFETIETLPASCTAPGRETLRCTACGKTQEKEIPATGHTEKTLPGTPPSCRSAGESEAVVCAVCGAVLQTAVPLEATGHLFAGWEAEPGTGVLIRRCLRCGETQRKDTGCAHDYIVLSAVAPGCETAGETVSACAKCGKTERALLPPTGHAYEETVVAPTCTAGGFTDHICRNCGTSYRDAETAAAGHTPQTTGAAAASCAAAGYSGDTVCAVCGALLESGAVLPALPHTPGEAAVTEAPTCTAAGKSEVCCAVCGATLSEETLPAPGHAPEKRYAENGAVCLTVCSRCGATLASDPLTAVKIGPSGERTDIYDLAAALSEAAAGDTLALVTDAVLPSSAGIPRGVTLVVPCFAGDTGLAENGTAPDADETENGDTKRRFCTLTVPEGVTLTVSGTLLVNARTGRRITAPGADQDVSGGYGEISLSGDIIVKNGGSFVCAGFVDPGDPAAGGTVTLASGAALSETMAVRRFRGAAYALNCAALGIWPVPETELACVRAKLIVHAGASLTGCVKLFLAAGTEAAAFHASTFSVIGENGLVRLLPGARAEREIRVSETGEVSCRYDLYGGAVFGASRFTFFEGAYLDTGDFWFPVNGDVSVSLYGGDYRLGADFLLLPGGCVRVGEGAALSVPAGAGLALAGEAWYEKDAGVGACAYPAGRAPAALYIEAGGAATASGTLAGPVSASGTLSASAAARSAVLFVPDTLQVRAADRERYRTELS